MILFESSRDNLLQPYVDLYNSRVTNPEDKTTVSQMKQFLLRKFVNEGLMRNLSLDSNYYLAGVARYYFHGDLTTNKELNVFNPEVKDEFKQDVCERLNAVIIILRNAYIDTVGQTFEQPEDFGTLSIAKLLRKYNKAINKELGIETPKKGEEPKPEIDRNDRVGNGYTFDILYDYEEAKKYNRATEPGAWCITYMSHMYDHYISRYKVHYVVLRKDGWESIERKRDPQKCPRDEYGNSLIALLQSNTSKEPVIITSRWNHGGFDIPPVEADHAYTKQQLMEITGISDADLQRIYDIWKADKAEKDEANKTDRKAIMAIKTKALRILKYTQMRLNNGMAWKEAWGDYYNNLRGRLLTNLKADKELSEKTIDLPLPERLKAAWKLAKKSAYGCVLVVDGRYFSFIMNNGKIVFDSVVDLGTNFISPNSVFGSNETKEVSSYYWDCSSRCGGCPENIIITGGEKTGYCLYDRKKNAMVTVDGKRKFKYIHFDSNRYGEVEEISHYAVGLTKTTWALLDVKTNNPIVLPNGSPWFEKIDTNLASVQSWRGDIHAIKANKFSALCFTYDSARREEYIYDLATRKFLDISSNDGVSLEYANFAPGAYVVKKSDARWSENIPLYVYENGERSKNFPEEFSQIFSYGCGHSTPKGIDITVFVTTDNKVFFYDKGSGQRIYFPEGIINSTGGKPYISHCEGYFIALDISTPTTDNGDIEPNLLIYSLQGKCFMKNTSGRNRVNSNPYIFPPYGYGNWRDERRGCGCWNFEEKDTIEFHSNFFDEIYKLNPSGEIEKVSETHVNRENLLAENRTRLQFTENDIRAMVTECVKKIIKKK